MIQWWVDAWPRQVFAYGARNYFGPDGWHNPSRQAGHPLTQEEQIAHCPYHQYWQSPEKKRTPPPGSTRPILPYRIQYQAPRYIYDEEIDIEDTYAAVISYHNGVMMNYSCNFSAPWEGYRLGINGTLGRLETTHYSAPSRCPIPVPAQNSIRVLPLFGPMEEILVPVVEGGHGGADGAIQRDLFINEDAESQRLRISAGSLAGSYAVATGEAIWQSVASNQPVNIPRFE